MNTTDNIPTIYVRHLDPHNTGEGLGSHMRRTLYPLLQISLKFGWEVIWDFDSNPCWKDNEYRSSYSHECLELGSWLGFDTKYSDLDRDRTIMTPLHIDGNDARFGNLRGEPEIINFVLEEYISKYGLDSFVGRNDSNRCDPVLITLFGRFEYKDDPTPPVLHWMQNRCSEWKVQAGNTRDEEASEDITANNYGRNLNIVLHLRVPEVFVSLEWEEANRISHAVATLEKVWEQISIHLEDFDGPEKKSTIIHLDIFTEESFTRVMELELMESLCKSGTPIRDNIGAVPISNSVATSNITVHRQTPLLPTVQSMAVADIFIPASSYLSSMAAFFQTSLIVLPNEATRRHTYFATHLKYKEKFQVRKDPNNKFLYEDHKLSSSSCPIVEVENDEELKAAINYILKMDT